MPLMLAMFTELLEIPSVLSIVFQKEKVDIVSTMHSITKTNKRLILFEKKPFAKLPHLKYLLSKCNQVDGENYCQNVKLSNLETSFDSLLLKKNKFLDDVKSSMKDWLSEQIESNKIFESIVQILNTEGWECKKTSGTKKDGNTISDFEFTDTHVEYLYEHFNISLAAVGVKISSVDVLNQWHELQYSKEFLSTA